MKLKQTFEPKHGELVRLSDLIGRITAPNSSPFTFHGTNSYIVGEQLTHNVRICLLYTSPSPRDRG